MKTGVANEIKDSFGFDDYLNIGIK